MSAGSANVQIKTSLKTQPKCPVACTHVDNITLRKTTKVPRYRTNVEAHHTLRNVNKLNGRHMNPGPFCRHRCEPPINVIKIVVFIFLCSSRNCHTKKLQYSSKCQHYGMVNKNVVTKFTILTLCMRVVHLHSLDLRIIFPLSRRAKKLNQALFLKTNSQFPLSLSICIQKNKLQQYTFKYKFYWTVHKLRQS
jgi:hypothetical protein